MSDESQLAITMMMRDALTGQQIHDVYVDEHITYITLVNGTLVSITGVVIVDVSNTRTDDRKS